MAQLVERALRVREVPGSNPGTPTERDMERDSFDKATCSLILETFASKPLLGQRLFQGYVLDEWGGPIVGSKEEAIKILDNPGSRFEQRIAAVIFAESYKRVLSIIQSAEAQKTKPT